MTHDDLTPAQRRSLEGDLAHKHTPDSIKDDIRRELRADGYTDREIKNIELGRNKDD